MEVEKARISQGGGGGRREDVVFPLNLLHLKYQRIAKLKCPIVGWKYESDAQKRDLDLGPLISKH